jgi:cytoskeleton protein RodZ
MTSQRELIPIQPGELLRYERKQQGLTVEQASQKSRIKPAVIEAIESGDTSEIPSVYLRGYIRNYARQLGVDPSKFEDQMEHVQGAEPEVRSVFTVDTRRGGTEKWLKVSSYLAASALIAALAWQFTHEAVRISQGEPRVASGAAGSPVPDGAAVDGGEQDKRPANSHLNASIASVEMLKQRSELARSGTAEQAWAAISGEGVNAADGGDGPHYLSVTTSADTWVEIQDGQGDQLELDLIRAGSTRQYGGTAPFQIMLGRASAVVLTLDGEAIDLAPYTDGDVARLTLGAELAADAARTTEADQN